MKAGEGSFKDGRPYGFVTEWHENGQKASEVTYGEVWKRIDKKCWDAADRRKIKAVIDQVPFIDIRMVFQNPYNKISKKSKTTYAKWCEERGIPWCSYSTIPIEWLI